MDSLVSLVSLVRGVVVVAAPRAIALWVFLRRSLRNFIELADDKKIAAHRPT